MNTTITALLTLACPALIAVCLYRASHRKHRRPATVAAWCLALPAVAGPVLAAQHTQGWGVVGWLLQLLTCAICIGHLAGWKLSRKRRSRKRRPSDNAKTALPTKQAKPAIQTEDVPELRQPELEQDRAEWERRINDVLYDDEAEDEAPEYNIMPAVSVTEHREQLHQALRQDGQIDDSVPA